MNSSGVNWQRAIHNFTPGETDWRRDRSTYIQYDVGAAGVELAVLGFCNWDQTAPNNAPNGQPSGMGTTFFLQSRGEIEKVNWPD